MVLAFTPMELTTAFRYLSVSYQMTLVLVCTSLFRMKRLPQSRCFLT